MIKVNLLQNRGVSSRTQVGVGAAGTATDMTGPVATSGSDFVGGFGASSGAVDNRGALINLIVLVIFPGLLIYYERMNLEALKRTSVQVQSEVTKITSQINEKKAEISKSADLKEKAKELANKIEILKKLSRIRLREIKALDFIQASIPEKVWLKELIFKAGALTIKGYSLTDDDLTTFVRSLEKSRGFSGVVLLQAKEERTKEGSLKSFEVSATVEAE